MERDLSLDEAERFLKSKGQSASRVLSQLNKNRRFKAAMDTDIGRELLTNLTELLDARLEVLINGKQEDSPMGSLICPHCSSDIPSNFLKASAEYNILRELAMGWATKIDNYQRGLQSIRMELVKGVK